MSAAPEIPAPDLEVTVVIPCLNEEKTVGHCVAVAVAALRAGGLAGEVVVADNGSRDASRERALAAGARIVTVERRGYGSALMAGIAGARGRFVIMGDADASYDFAEVPRFVAKLREGYDLVQGCRLPRGGGTVAPGAMPWSHRWIGNPALSLLARIFFHTGLNDVYCGLRGFTPDFARRMEQRCTGMEFATEMIIKAGLHRVRLTELPITLHRDRREGTGSHLRTFRDGWRTLRLFLLYSPRWLHLFPSAALLAFGLVAGVLAWLGVRIGPATLGPHTLLVAVVLILLGYQGLMLALFARTFAWRENLAPASPFLEKFYRVFTLERALVLSLCATLAGALLIGSVFWTWRGLHYGELSYAVTLRRLVPGLLLVALAAQTFFGSFVISLASLEPEMSAPNEPPEFDAYARDYEAGLDRGLSLTGESRNFFARRRVEIVREAGARLGLHPRTVCDYGCGTGDTLPLLRALLGAERVLGLDPSLASLAEARRRHADAAFAWMTPDDDATTAAANRVDAVYCNGVFHHIPPAARLDAARQVVRLLRPGGCWFFWENNPLNPGTRWVMARIPFDRDAITLRARETRQLGEAAGATWLETSYHFYFPHALRSFRGAEKWLRALPLGGQYLVVFRKPAAG